MTPALSPHPPMLLFVANGVELLRCPAALAPQIWDGEYLALYDTTTGAMHGLYQVKRRCHRIPILLPPPLDATVPLRPWETVIDLTPMDGMTAEAFQRHFLLEGQ